MSKNITLYHLQASPNCMKARIGLALKDVSYDKVDVNPDDRSDVVKVSGQPLAPVLVHNDNVIFDSGAILRYVDSTFREKPSLFSTDRQEMRDIERWEWLGRTDIPEPVAMVFGQAFSDKPDMSVCKKATQYLQDRTGPLEDKLSNAEWLCLDRITAADVTIAPWVFYGTLTEQMASTHPFMKFFFENLHLGEGRDRTRAWVQKVMANNK